MRPHYYEGASGDKVYDGYLMKRLLVYLKPYTKHVIAAACLLLVVSALGLAGPYLIKVAIDRYIQTKNLRGLNWIALIFLGVMALEFILRYWQIYLMQFTGQKVMFDLRLKLFSHLQQMPVSFFTEQSVGGLMSRVVNDIAVLNEMFSAGIVAVLGDIIMLLGIMLVLLLMNWRLALVVFTVIPLLFYASYIFRKKVRKSFRDIRRYMAGINSFLQENITGMPIVQVFNRQDKNLKQFEKINGSYLDAYLETIFYYSVFFPIVEILSSLAIALVLWYGGEQVLQKVITFGVLVAFIEYGQRFFRPVNDLMEKYNIFQSAMAAAERIFKLLDTLPAINDAAPATAWPCLEKEITFRRVWFAYHQEDYVLRDINLTLRKGEKVALVGLTGAGKTSIVGLLNRFYEAQKGQILLDGIDIRRISQHDLRRCMGMILQEPFLFSGSVMRNICLGRQDISPDKVGWAARQVNAHNFITELPDGYQHEIKERGANLSAGQKQLLTFARALVFDPQILILDEATSNIDSQTEYLIQDALDKLMRKRTAIIIAHRLSTIKKVDRIIVLDKGRIKEEGTHRELLARQGVYAKLYKLQFANEADSVHVQFRE